MRVDETGPAESSPGPSEEVREAILRLLRDSTGDPQLDPEDDAPLSHSGLDGEDLEWIYFTDRFRRRFGRDPSRLGDPSSTTVRDLVEAVEEGLWWEYPPAPSSRAADLARSDFFPRLFRPGLHVLFRALLRMVWSLRVEGRHHIPKKGAFVLVSNHAGHPDAPVLMASVRLGRVNDTHPLAAQDYFFSRRRIGSTVHFLLNALPIDRSVKAPDALKDALDLLDEGKGVIIFPEGTRSVTGEIARFRRGVGLLLAGRPWPVVPTYIEGSHQVLPKGAKRPRRHPLRVKIGPPVHYTDFEDTPDSWQRIAGDLEQRVRRLQQGGTMEGRA